MSNLNSIRSGIGVAADSLSKAADQLVAITEQFDNLLGTGNGINSHPVKRGNSARRTPLLPPEEAKRRRAEGLRRAMRERRAAKNAARNGPAAPVHMEEVL